MENLWDPVNLADIGGSLLIEHNWCLDEEEAWDFAETIGEESIGGSLLIENNGPEPCGV
mgnify:CR=1 FL=1